jgi:hypothetical protein
LSLIAGPICPKRIWQNPEAMLEDDAMITHTELTAVPQIVKDSHEQMLVENDRPAQRSSSLLLAAACSLATLGILTCSPHVCLPPKLHSLPSHP